ncbi:MAG: class I SAM-dependent methyltransferase [Candidatus Marinimicrobia bacterium]|nr:class I SAM-dependent methyltransferase [Candidatus Neomarinimicrobiota bacterium]MBL7022513.1 class I SAM-dependent methyltransferase [Candidatus Neomarinimicrobiota bacterium]MBL7108632.1 class I SAM-dependent methyltransferase [Candidatus Neomarinimicrobiota bacterium]
MTKLTTYKNTVYKNGQRWDNEHWWYKKDLDFWKNIVAESSGKKVLELASGTGRIALPLVREGAEYTGIELSKDFCKTAEQKLKSYPNTKIINGDMRDFNLNKKFDLVFIGFNSFLHLLTDNDAQNFLECVKKHLHENSRFIIEIFVPNPLFLHRPDGMRFSTMEFTDSKTGETVSIEETNEYNPETEVNYITWYYSTHKKKDFDILQFSLRMFYPDTMNRLLIDNGFTILDVWGDYYRTQFNEESKLQIYNCSIF